MCFQTWALECDLSQEKKGPLHGMPISIKDNFGIEVSLTFLTNVIQHLKKSQNVTATE